jgi:3-hydroxypropanoate dehydrogenase
MDVNMNVNMNGDWNPDALDAVSQQDLDRIFLKARTHHGWVEKPVGDEIIRHIYDILRWGPTSSNTCPGRFVFVRTPEAKEKLVACLDKGNIEQTRTAPVTAIVAYDLDFYEKLPKLVTHTDARKWFVGKEELVRSTAFRNGTLQGGYLILAARALGLDCGPMSGFDNAKVDEAFFKGTSWRSNFLCNLGYGDPGKLHPRAPRLDFEESCRLA